MLIEGTFSYTALLPSDFFTVLLRLLLLLFLALLFLLLLPLFLLSRVLLWPPSSPGPLLSLLLALL